MSTKWDNNEPVQRFREYLRIPSVHPDIDYGECVKFLQKQAAELDLPFVVYELVPKKPIVVITWEGSQPELPSILLNSHMDVVPVYEEHWTHPPFSAHIADDGFIYARGAQDMKCVGIINLEVVRRLKRAGVRLKRTVHISFVPDEEIGGADGMKVFSESQHCKDLNIGFGLDESSPSSKPDKLYAFNGERTCRQIVVTSKARPTHGSFLPPDTAGEKLHYVIDKFMKLRAEERRKYKSGKQLGDVTSVNLTKLEGGVQVNVLPGELSATFDIRISPDVNHEEFEQMIDRWCAEAGTGVSYQYFIKNPQIPVTKIDGSMPFWSALEKAVNDIGIEVICGTAPGTTDSRYLRKQGIPMINLTPVVNSPVLLHCHNERLHADAFLYGIDIMEKILVAVANCPQIKSSL